MTTVYGGTATRLKKTSTRMTQRQLAIMAKVTPATICAWKKAGALNEILDENGLILHDKARAWVMRNVKRQKKEAKA